MPEISIARAIGLHADRHPERPALTCGGVTLARRELHRSSSRLARAYATLGVRQGDLVTIALPNSVEFMLAAVAAWKLGATPMPVSAKLPGLELEELITLARPGLIVGVTADRAGGHPSVPPGFVPDPSLPDEPLPDCVAPHFKAPTSGGSTGRPKIIVSARPGRFDPEAPLFQLPTEAAVVAPGVLYHNAPFTISALALVYGDHVINMPRFDAEEMLALVERHRAAYLYLVPTMMQRLWRLPASVRARHDVSSLRIAIHMAAPCPPWLKDAFIDWLGPDVLCELYGGTEQQAATWITGREWRERRGSVGRAVVGKIRILDESGRELPAGKIGEIFMMPDEGPGTTYRYIGAEPRAVDGWESIGDLGWLDADGYLYLTDRRTDLILRGGANIYPAEVEAALDAHPAVRSSAVIGLPDEDLGQRVHAIVDAPEGIDEHDLRRHLAERLVDYKRPASFEFVSEPLRDEAGKLRREALRAARVPHQTP